MGMNDENEIIKLSCSTGATKLCKDAYKEGTYKELFGDIPSTRILPKLVCSECGGEVRLAFTGRYKCFVETYAHQTRRLY